MGRLVALGVALLITAVAVFSTGASSGDAQASSMGGLPVIVPEARSAPPAGSGLPSSRPRIRRSTLFGVSSNGRATFCRLLYTSSSTLITRVVTIAHLRAYRVSKT